MTVFETLGEYLSQPFVQKAALVVILVALCAALLGVPLVLKRFSMIGDGLSHVAFGAAAVAAVLGVAVPLYVVLPVTVAAAVLLLRTGSNPRIRGDAAVAMISVAALAFGYLLLGIFRPDGNFMGDACSSLFGSSNVLLLSDTDVWISIVMSVAVILVFILFYNKLFAVSFDENFARACGTGVSGYNTLLAMVAAVVIVLAMNFIGALMVSALIIFPTLSAMRLARSFRGVIVVAAVFGVVTAAAGITVSVLIPHAAVGPTVVAADVVGFGLCCALGALRRK